LFVLSYEVKCLYNTFDLPLAQEQHGELSLQLSVAHANLVYTDSLHCKS